MNPDMLELYSTARSELAELGEVGRPLLATLELVVFTAGSRGVGVLADPAFALEVLGRGGGQTSPALVGRMLGHLRTRAGVVGDGGGAMLSVAAAAAQWEAEAFALRAPTTARAYRSWIRRLVDAHGGASVTVMSAVDLANLIASYTRGDGSARGRQQGLGSEETAVAAFRHFWAYLIEKGAVSRNVARSLRKPLRPEPQRRPIRVDEAALMRQFARMGQDPLLDETALCLVERLGMRPVEVTRLRLCDVDLVGVEVRILGKGDRPRRLPLPPGLARLLKRYVEDRCPEEMSCLEFSALAHPFLRHRPTPTEPEGCPVGEAWLDRLFPRLLAYAPQLRREDLFLYAYRHAIASWVDANYGRGMTRRLLGHTSRLTATDQYVHVSEDDVREAVRGYEEHLVKQFGG